LTTLVLLVLNASQWLGGTLPGDWICLINLLIGLQRVIDGEIVQQWLTQWGTSSAEDGSGVAVDGAGRTWVSGYTESRQCPFT